MAISDKLIQTGYDYAKEIYAQYGVDIDASIEQGNVFACQFHPEKSSDVGLKILSNFLKICEKK